MLTKEIDHFYLKQEESVKSCLLALRQIILSQNKDVVAVWKYGMPFFCYKNKMFCYLWVHKKHKKPYIGIVEGNHFNHPDLIIEKRSRMKIMVINPDEDLPINTIQTILIQAIDLYKKGIIKVK
jgi:hypothetical protein